MHTIGMSFFILLCRSVSMVTAYHYRFTLVDLGDVGRHSDGGVLSHSEFGKALEENSIFLPAPQVPRSVNYHMLLWVMRPSLSAPIC